MTEKGRVIVVGGGLAGLTAATLAARAGKRVTLLERATAPGGRATSRTIGEATMNQGPHALYLAGAAARILAELGVTYSGRPADPKNARVLHEGELVSMPKGAGSLLTSPLLGWRGRLEVGQLLATVGPKLAEDGETVAAWLVRVMKDEDARAFMAGLFRVTTYANAPHLSSAKASLTNVALALRKGVLYMDGGWQTLVDGLLAKAAEAGVEIVGGAAAGALERRGAEWEVRYGNGSATADDVVLAVGPATASELTGASFDLVPIHAACLDLSLPALPDGTPEFVLGLDSPLYFSVHSVAAKLAPAGVTVLQVAKYIDPREAVDADRDRAELESLVDRVVPGLRERAHATRFLPRMTVANAVVTPKGRPDVDATGATGVHLAGDWVGPEGMLADAAIASAARAVQALLRRTGSRTKVAAEAAHAQGA